MASDKFRMWAAPLAVLFVWLAFLVPSLDKSRMQEVDELTHARVAQAAALNGHWCPLMLDGRVFYEKPPLLLWLAGATAKFSGRPYDSWPYRIWPCLGAGLALACLILIGRLVRRPWVGVVALVGLALQGDFIYHARFFTFDTPFIACMLASLVFSLRAVRRGHPGDWGWAGLALGLAVAFKSWFVLALIPAYVCAVFAHVPRSQRLKTAWALGMPPLVVLLFWILLYVCWNGLGFLSEEWSNNLMGRIAGKNFTLDPDGHAAFYLNWAAWTAPALLPWVLAIPLTLVPSGLPRSGAMDVDGRVLAFLRTWTCAFIVSWLLGLVLVRAETMNYVLPLEAALCLGAGLTMDAGFRMKRGWVGTVLVAASVLATLRVWAPVWSLGVGALLGLTWLFLGQAKESKSKALAWAPSLSVVLGLGLAGLLAREALGFLNSPLDPNRILAELLLAHPAASNGEKLWFQSAPTQAPNFYSSYQVQQLDSLPQRRPVEASLVKIRGGWIFFPAGGVLPAVTSLDRGRP